MSERSINQRILRFGETFAAEQRPTMTYDPLQGQDFVRRLISPISIDTVILLIRSGWSAGRVMRMVVQQINGIENARSASGPTPELAPDYEEFQVLAENLRELQYAREVRIGYDTDEEQLSGVFPANRLNAEDFVAAAKEGWKIHSRREKVLVEIDLIEEENPEVTDEFLIGEVFESLVKQVKEQGLTEPLRVRFDQDRKKFLIQENALMFRASQKAGLNQILCYIEDENDYVLTGSVQSLVLRWDPRKELDTQTSNALAGLPNLSE